jgi:hypothetical protein
LQADQDTGNTSRVGADSWEGKSETNYSTVYETDQELDGLEREFAQGESKEVDQTLDSARLGNTPGASLAHDSESAGEHTDYTTMDEDG